MGHLAAAPDAQGRVNSYVIPRRMLTVHPKCQIQPGDLFYGPDREVLMVATDGTNTTRGDISRLFKVYTLDQKLAWSRTTTVTDAVTGLEKSSTTTSLGDIWGTLEILGPVSDTIDVPVPTYRVLTNATLTYGDILNGTYRVRSVETALGITVAEVQ